MKLNPLNKLEKQAEKYLKDNPVVMPPGWQEEYDRVYSELDSFRLEWDQYQKICQQHQDKGGHCICKTLPRYQELVIEKIQPRIDRLNAMFSERSCLEKQRYEKHLQFLISGRRAKEKFLKTS